MKTQIILMIGIFLAANLSCRFLSTEGQPTETTEATIEVTTEATTEARTYENDIFIVNIPEGWGTGLSEGEYFDLNVEEKVTIHSAALRINSDAFFTIASSPLATGETLESRFDLAYKKGPQIEDVSTSPFERDTLSGIDITYKRPWGEPWWQFRDIWLEKDGVLYVLSLHTTPNKFESYAETFSLFLDGFSFKD